jgi:hypothetical protein
MSTYCDIYTTWAQPCDMERPSMPVGNDLIVEKDRRILMESLHVNVILG